MTIEVCGVEWQMIIANIDTGGCVDWENRAIKINKYLDDWDVASVVGQMVAMIAAREAASPTDIGHVVATSIHDSIVRYRDEWAPLVGLHAV